MVGDKRQNDVMSTGLPGRLGSTPCLLVGMGFCKHMIIYKTLLIFS